MKVQFINTHIMLSFILHVYNKKNNFDGTTSITGPVQNKY